MCDDCLHTLAHQAMKMQNVLHAEKKSVVKSVNLEPGAVMQLDELIVEFE